VNGARQTVTLEFTETSREGVHALKRTWPTAGTWTLVIKANQGPDDLATAVVELGPDGEVAAVRVPTTERAGWTVPAPVSMDQIDAALRTRAAALATKSRTSEAWGVGRGTRRCRDVRSPCNVTNHSPLPTPFRLPNDIPPRESGRRCDRSLKRHRRRDRARPRRAGLSGVRDCAAGAGRRPARGGARRAGADGRDGHGE